MSPKYQRVLLKLSGEALAGPNSFGLHPPTIERICKEVKEVVDMGVGVSIVTGGGNIFRGLAASAKGMDRTTADHMGMLATIMNGLALQDCLEKLGTYTRVMSAIDMPQICEAYIRRRAVRHLEKKRVIIFAGGTGNPYFTTDTAASLRAAEIGAEVILKATKVNGVYTDDPMKNDKATLIDSIDHLDVLKNKLKVMDSTAISLCMDNELPIIVFNLNNEGNFKRIIEGERIGTLVKK